MSSLNIDFTQWIPTQKTVLMCAPGVIALCSIWLVTALTNTLWHKNAKESVQKEKIPPRAGRRRVMKNPFLHRQSFLDGGTQILTPWKSRQESTLNQSVFHGWYTLSWLMALSFLISKFLSNYEKHGHILANLDAILGILGSFHELVLSTLILYFFSFSAFGIQTLISINILRDEIWTRRILHIFQHLLQSIMIFGVLGFVYLRCRHWSFSQKLALVMTLMTTYMKMHSYLLSNFELWEMKQKFEQQKQSNIEIYELEDLESKDSEKIKKELLKRGIYKKSLQNQTIEEQIKLLNTILEREKYRREIYPSNVKLWNFIEFTCMPTLVYEPDYPRTDHIRIIYIIEKIFMGVGVLTVMWMIMETSIWPHLIENSKIHNHVSTINSVQSILSLLFPFTMIAILMFIFVFDCFCNSLAEITRFADREFYQDWWNSTTFDEFARKWNRPVHEFLLRHVYLHSMNSYKFTRNLATAGTFFFSIALHEIILSACFHRVRPWLSFFSLLQIPLISVMRSPIFKGKPLGNIVFWSGLILGLPLISILYAKDYCSQPSFCT